MIDVRCPNCSILLAKYKDGYIYAKHLDYNLVAQSKKVSAQCRKCKQKIDWEYKPKGE